MTVRILRSRHAAAEIEEIASYLEEHSPPAADFLTALESAQRQPAEFPNSGTPALLSGTRHLILGDYIVSYRRRETMSRSSQ